MVTHLKIKAGTQTLEYLTQEHRFLKLYSLHFAFTMQKTGHEKIGWIPIGF